MPSDLLSIADLSADELWHVLEHARQFKHGKTSAALARKGVALLFEKPSLRTRVSFDVAVHQMGGHAIYLGQDEVGLGKREPVADVARVLERYVQCIVARVFAHETLQELARYASIPVINALSDREHPCQALGDLLTIQERRGSLSGLTVAFVGDGNNVASSLALACATTGASFAIATPPGYELPDSVLRLARQRARASGAQVRTARDPKEAVRGAQVVYTDAWISMGQEAEQERRLRDFAAFQVNEALLAKADPHAILMHCLPAHDGQEVAPGLLDLPQSVVFSQAENRLHAQKGVLELLFGAG